MTGTHFALIALGVVIGGMLYRVVRGAISGALARKHLPRDGDLPIALTPVNRRRLLVLLADAANVGGSDVWRLAGGFSGRVYSDFLVRLERAGLVVSEWDPDVPAHTYWRADPRRRYYRLTPEGRAVAMQALDLKEGVRQ
jgi:hypothetical protein